jgi:hypothetical protein
MNLKRRVQRLETESRLRDEPLRPPILVVVHSRDDIAACNEAQNRMDEGLAQLDWDRFHIPDDLCEPVMVDASEYLAAVNSKS